MGAAFNMFWFYIGFSVGLAVGVSAVILAVSSVLRFSATKIDKIANKDV